MTASRMNAMTVAAITVVGFLLYPVSGFCPMNVRNMMGIITQRHSSSSNGNDSTSTTPATPPRVPLNFDEMVNEVARASIDAKEAGLNRQSIRILLPRDPTNAQLGRIYEDNAATLFMNNNLQQTAVLVPPDETWQGGIMQLYRACVPTCRTILRKLSGTTGGVPPRIMEDRSIDESGVDGCGLLLTQSNASPLDDVSCFVQPTQEVIQNNIVRRLCEQAGEDRLVLLVNPQWRDRDDALDTVSKNTGLLGSFASFLGGKGNVLSQLTELGFQNAYTMEGYVCKGGNIRLLKRFDSDWIVFAENDSLTDYIMVGTSTARPTYQDCEKMLDEKGISLKYARDIGLAPKFEE